MLFRSLRCATRLSCFVVVSVSFRSGGGRLLLESPREQRPLGVSSCASTAGAVCPETPWRAYACSRGSSRWDGTATRRPTRLGPLRPLLARVLRSTASTLLAPSPLSSPYLSAGHGTSAGTQAQPHSLPTTIGRIRRRELVLSFERDVSSSYTPAPEDLHFVRELYRCVASCTQADR